MILKKQMWRNLWMLAFQCLALSRGEQRWGILSAFPKPLPVHHAVAVFPRFFTTQKELGLPTVIGDTTYVSLGEDRNFKEIGALCFTIDSPRNSCIGLRKQAFGWFKDDRIWGKNSQERRNSRFGAENSTSQYLFANYTFYDQAVWFNKLYQQHLAPHCWGTYEGDLWPWSECQSTAVGWADEGHLFTFSPEMRGHHPYPASWTDGLFIQDPRFNPFSKWVLCGVNGSCSDLTPFVLLQGGTVAYSNVSGNLHTMSKLKEEGDSDWGPAWTGLNTSGGIEKVIYTFGRNASYTPVPVCVHPPFLFVLSNSTFDKCTNTSCYLSQCWDSKIFKNAMVLRVPRWVPVPVEVSSTLTLFRRKRDFGITAAVIAAMAAIAVSATAAGLAMATSVQTAQTRRDKVVISQALAALECGSSPQIWLSALKGN